MFNLIGSVFSGMKINAANLYDESVLIGDEVSVNSQRHVDVGTAQAWL